MVSLGLHPRVVDYVEMATSRDPRARLEEVMIDAGSPWIGRTVAEAAGDAHPLLLRRAGGDTVPNPPPSETVGEGDLLVLFGERSELERADRA